MPIPTEPCSMFKTGIRHEVAQDVLGALIAHAAHELARAREATNPDPARIAAIGAEQRQWRDRREALDHRDAAQIEALIAELGPLARRIYARD
jgi:hypothetical protein